MNGSELFRKENYFDEKFDFVDGRVSNQRKLLIMEAMRSVAETMDREEMICNLVSIERARESLRDENEKLIEENEKLKEENKKLKEKLELKEGLIQEWWKPFYNSFEEAIVGEYGDQSEQAKKYGFGVFKEK